MVAVLLLVIVFGIVEFGLAFRDVRGPALAASSPATDFGGLFLALSFFLLVAAFLCAALALFLSFRREPRIGKLLLLDPSVLRKEGTTVFYSPADRRIIDACQTIRTVLIESMKKRGLVAEELDIELVPFFLQGVAETRELGDKLPPDMQPWRSIRKPAPPSQIQRRSRHREPTLPTCSTWAAKPRRFADRASPGRRHGAEVGVSLEAALGIDAGASTNAAVGGIASADAAGFALSRAGGDVRALRDAHAAGLPVSLA